MAWSLSRAGSGMLRMARRCYTQQTEVYRLSAVKL